VVGLPTTVVGVLPSLGTRLPSAGSISGCTSTLLSG
jgi:hypothetical protein